MKLPIVYRLEVGDDLDEAFAWCERQRQGLGDEFLSEVRDQIERIQSNPEIYAVLYRSVRASPVRRFQYVVYYRVDSDSINVIAIQHGHRNPRRWKARA
jgi:toxin ParE1/3/4